MKIKVGQGVKWIHTLPAGFGNKKEEFMGIVLKIYSCVVGGKKEVSVAKIAVCKNDYWDFLRKKTTVIKIEKLEPIIKII